MKAEGNVLQIRAEIEMITKPKKKLEKRERKEKDPVDLL